MLSDFVFSSRRRQTRCALVTGVQTCALPICLERGDLLGAENIVEHQISVTVELFGLSARDRRAFVPTAVHHRVQPGEDARGGLAPGRVKIGHFIPSSGVCTLRRAQAAAAAGRYAPVSSWTSLPVTGG